ncbi:MAG: hypothetical protein P8R54_22255 [Myxococcota bacterium]|nr:hypothetical protein [Myxococcota bacterium]
MLFGLSGLLVVGLGGAGSWLHAIPVSGLVVGPVLLRIVAQHGAAGLLLMWGGLTGRLPIASWMAAREVAVSAGRDLLIVGFLGTAFGVLQLGGVPAEQQLSAVSHAVLPLMLAVGLHLTLLSPLLKGLTQGHSRWSSALQEALTPPPLIRPVSRPQTASVERGVA